MKMKITKRSHRYDINRLGLDMDKNIVNKKSVSVWWCLYVLSNTQATNTCSSIYEKVKQHWRWVEKSIAYKKSAYIIYPIAETEWEIKKVPMLLDHSSKGKCKEANYKV